MCDCHVLPSFVYLPTRAIFLFELSKEMKTENVKNFNDKIHFICDIGNNVSEFCKLKRNPVGHNRIILLSKYDHILPFFLCESLDG